MPPCLYIGWRWKGVPYLRSGKRLAAKASEIAVQFKGHQVFFFREDEDFFSPNLLVIRIQPNEVTLYLNSKTTGLETQLQPIELSFGYETTFGSNTPEAYERLILDALNGDGTLFIEVTKQKSHEPTFSHFELLGRAENKRSGELFCWNLGTYRCR